MSENYTKVQQAFRVLHPLLAGYICQEMRREYQDNWWQEVLMTLSDQVRDLPDDNGDYAALMDSLDMANCLRLFDRKWNDLFKRKLSIDYRTWAKELMGVQHKLAHIGGTVFRRMTHGVRWTPWRACAKPLTMKPLRRSARSCASSATAAPKAPPTWWRLLPRRNLRLPTPVL